jgi:hypothetical protein
MFINFNFYFLHLPLSDLYLWDFFGSVWKRQNHRLPLTFRRSASACRMWSPHCSSSVSSENHSITKLRDRPHPETVRQEQWRQQTTYIWTDGQKPELLRTIVQNWRMIFQNHMPQIREFMPCRGRSSPSCTPNNLWSFYIAKSTISGRWWWPRLCRDLTLRPNDGNCKGIVRATGNYSKIALF